jgi:hypothetical protein
MPRLPTISNVTTNLNWKKCWDFYRFTERLPGENSYTVSNFTEEATTQHNELVNWIKLFPYKSIRNVKFNRQIHEVGEHLDFDNPLHDLDLYNNNSMCEPCGYRVLVSGNKSGLYVVNSKGEKIYSKMPDDTDVYVLGHTNVRHGVDFEPGRETLFLHFELNYEDHIALLETSYNKYKKYAILDQ